MMYIKDDIGQRLTRIFVNKEELFQGVLAPHGSVHGFLRFNIYLNNLFYLSVSTEVCYFADETTFFACDKDLNTLIERLEHDSY